MSPTAGVVFGIDGVVVDVLTPRNGQSVDFGPYPGKGSPAVAQEEHKP